MVHKKEEGTYHHIETLMKEMPGFLSPGRGLLLLNIQELIRSREFLTDPKQHTGSLLLNAFWQLSNDHLIRSCGLKSFSGLSHRVSLACDHFSPACRSECSATLLLFFVPACSDTLQSWGIASRVSLPWDWPHSKNLLRVMLPCQLVLRTVHG